jgi:GntR family transcriptional regulator
VRQLAKRLRVNPATVVQAYRELEREGFVEMRQGSGTFIREVQAARREKARRDQATRLVRAMLKEAARLGLDRDEIAAVLQREFGGVAS